MEKNAAGRILILHGTLVGADRNSHENLLLDNGIIAARGNFEDNSFPDAAVIDATGKFIIPGGFDPHVHLALPTPAGNSCDNFRTGSLAALSGGTTYFMDFVTPRRGQPLLDALRLRRVEAAESLSGCGLHMGISEWNPKVAAEIIPCIEKEGIRSFKAYLAYRQTIGIGYDNLFELMQIVGPAGGMVMVHCEDGEMIGKLQNRFMQEDRTRPFNHALSRPPEAEADAIKKVVELSAKTGCPVYIVHISTGEGARLVAKARKDGHQVYAETCPHYLLLDDSVYDPGLDDMKVLPYVLSPPIRGKEDQQRLWEGISDGTFDVVATDHCPFNIQGQKDQGLSNFTRIPNGTGSISHRLGLLYTYGVLTNRISINRFVSLVSTRPAEIFGYGDRKGKLIPGYDADIVVWDPAFEGKITHNPGSGMCDHDIYEGFPVKGRAEVVIRASSPSPSGEGAGG